ncbi:MAG: hypothetical protein HN368_15765, partial [Spirochaetales bacterium]|nr:hypothetical protein [Spirochaetales bacterium]
MDFASRRQVRQQAVLPDLCENLSVTAFAEQLNNQHDEFPGSGIHNPVRNIHWAIKDISRDRGYRFISHGNLGL